MKSVTENRGVLQAVLREYAVDELQFYTRKAVMNAVNV